MHNLHSLRCERWQSTELHSASSPVLIPESLVLPFFITFVDDDNLTPSNSQSTVPHPQRGMALPDFIDIERDALSRFRMLVQALARQ